MRGHPGAVETVGLLVGLAVVGAAARVEAGGAGSAGCSNPNLPVAIGRDPITRGVLTLSVSSAWTRAEVQHASEDDVVGRGVIPVTHDEVLWIGETRVGAAYGVGGHVELIATLPFRSITTRTAYHDADGGSVALMTPDIHHRDETVAGLADPWLLARVAGRALGMDLELRAGLTLPLGATVNDPFALGAAGLPHQHLQLGVGTVTPLLGFEVARSVGTVRGALWGLTQQIVVENDHGWESGDRYATGIDVGGKLGRGVSLRGGLELQAETAERWHGRVPTEDGNQGRIDLLANAGVGLALSDALWLDVGLKATLLRDTVGADVSQPLLATVALSWRLPTTAAARAADAAAHTAAEERALAAANVDVRGAPVSWDGADLADLGAPGSVPALAPVPGKLTVIDLWARWCAPCGDLDRRLAPLARARADRLAVRKLDVVDWDSAAATTLLQPRGFGLPHVIVLAPDGHVLYEASGDPEGLVAKIEQLLQTVR